MSERDRGGGVEDFREALMQPAKTDDHLDVWAEETFDRLTKQSKHQEQREQKLQADLGELLDTFEELACYVE